MSFCADKTSMKQALLNKTKYIAEAFYNTLGTEGIILLIAILGVIVLKYKNHIFREPAYDVILIADYYQPKERTMITEYHKSLQQD